MINRNFKPNHIGLISRILFLFISLILIGTSCTKEVDCNDNPCGKMECIEQCCLENPCGNPDKCPNMCPDPPEDLPGMSFSYSTDDFTETTGSQPGETIVEGSGTVEIDVECTIFNIDLKNAVMRFQNGIFKGLSAVYKESTDQCNLFSIIPIAASEGELRIDLFWQEGQTILENYNLAYQIDPDKKYFVFGLRLDSELGFCVGNGNTFTGKIAEKPRFDLNAAQVIYMIDPCDPMYYMDLKSDLVGQYAVGHSLDGAFKYQPDHPLAGEIESFDGKSYRYGNFTFKFVFNMEGELFRTKAFDLDLVTDDFLSSDIGAEYSTGFNGTGSLNLKLFNIPFVSGSASFQTVLDTRGSYVRAFLNVESDKYGLWWPEFIPIKPTQRREISGFIISDLDSLLLRQKNTYGLFLKIDDEFQEYTLNGEGIITNNDLTVSGTVVANKFEWTTQGNVSLERTEITSELPFPAATEFVNNACSIGDSLSEVVSDFYVNNYLPDSLEYDLALDLQGLRQQLPIIADEIIAEIQSQKNSEIAGICDQAKACYDNDGLIKCTTKCETVLAAYIDPVLKPFIDDLKALKSAADKSLSDDEARKRLKDILNSLISKKTITISGRTVSFCRRTAGCIKTPVPISEITIDAIKGDLLNTLTKARDHIDLIPGAEGPYFDSEEILAQLRENGKTAIDLCASYRNGSKNPPNANRLGYRIYHETGDREYFYEQPDGFRISTGPFSIFDIVSFGKAVD